jgi:hypothetical protein
MEPRAAIGKETREVVDIQRRGRNEASNADVNASARTTETATTTGLAPMGVVRAAQSTKMGANVPTPTATA